MLKLNKRQTAQKQANETLRKQNAENAKQEDAQQQKLAESKQKHDEAIAKANETQRKQNEEKQKTSERMARKENERAKLSELNSQRTQKQLNSEKEAQEWLSKNYGTMTLSQKKMFLEASEGANTALQAYNNYNKALENNALNSLSIDIADVTEHITNLNTALSESASATGLTTDSISNLKSMFSGLDNYDEAALFENTANGIKLNREELDKLNQSYYDQKTDAAKEQLGLLKDKYNDLTSQINMCSDASQTANLYAQRDAVLDQINDVQSLISQYDGLTSAFNEWQNAQNETSPGANYDSMYSYIDTANELASDGKWGNPALKKYIELISGKDLSDATAVEMKKAWESLGGTIGNTGHNLMEFLTEDKTGVEKFIDTLKKLDDGYIQVGEDGQSIINIDNMGDLANKMGTDVSYVQVLLDKLSEYGWDIHVNSDELDLASTKAEEANEHLKELGATDYTFNFNADSDSIDKEIQKAKELINNPMFKDANGNFDINIEGAAEAQQILVNLAARKEELTNHPIIMDIDSSKLEGTNQTVIDDLKNLQSYISEYNIKIDPDINMDTTEVKKQVGDALDEIDKLPNDIQEKLGLADEKVKAAAQLLKQNIADGVTLNSDALSTIQQAIANIDPEILASLGIDMDDVQKQADATAQAFESALTSVLDNLVITVNGKKIEFTVGADTTQVDEATKKVQEEKAEAKSGWDFIMNAENKKVLDASEESKQAMTDLANGDYTAWARLNNTNLVNGIYTSQSLLDTFNGKTATAYINVVKKTTDVGVGMLMNSIKANGSFHGFAEGTFLRGYSNGTNVAIQKDQKAVINEVGCITQRCVYRSSWWCSAYRFKAWRYCI